MDIEAFLRKLGITFQRFDHHAVFTVEESSKLPQMPGADTKNLFLREEKGTQHFLVSVPHDKRTDMKQLATLLGVKRLVFGTEDDMKRLLGVTPGSVTLLGLMHDQKKEVEVWIDSAIWAQDAIQCHPLVNTATLVIPRTGMQTFLEATNHPDFHIAEIPAR